MNKETKILSPDGERIESHTQEMETKRSKERRREDRNYVPVIIKRTDEVVKHPDDILEKAIHEGMEQHSRTGLSLVISATAAGLILGFAAMCVAIMGQIFPASEGVYVHRLATGLIYPLGFIICIMSGTQLFTEQTATAVYPVLDKKVGVYSLLFVWFLVLVGNLIGTTISSLLLYTADSVILAKEGFLNLWMHLIEYDFSTVFVSAILAGWLMAQGGWLILSTPPASSQVICIFIVTAIIGVGGLHHSIVGSAEIFSGLLHSGFQHLGDSMKFLAASVLGNLVGGSCFVAILNYAHIRQTR